MTFLRRLFGLDFRDPAVGQVWRSRHSGHCMRVSSVETHDTGTIFVGVQYDHGNPGHWGIGSHYACGLDSWRRNLREERRELIEGVPMEPSQPWPRSGNVNPPPHYPKPAAPPGPPSWRTPGPAGFTPPPPPPPRPLHMLPPWLSAVENAARCLRMAHENHPGDIVYRSAAEELEQLAARTRGVKALQATDAHAAAAYNAVFGWTVWGDLPNSTQDKWREAAAAVLGVTVPDAQTIGAQTLMDRKDAGHG